MGADGGVVYLPLKKGTQENKSRVLDLIQPFWQFLCRNDCAHWAEDAHSEWESNNRDIDCSPDYIVGYYGTDRCDSFVLSELGYLCEVDDKPSYMGDLYALTFDELDLDCRTSPYSVGGRDAHRLHRLWHEHFDYKKREEVLTNLGPIANMVISDWCAEMNKLLYLERFVQEETWT
jgi:hypothetical protein